MTKEDVFVPILENIKNEDIKEFAQYLIVHDCPDYFYEIGASSTGKYHPQYAVGELGLARHTCALVRFLIWITELEYVKEKIDDRTRDLLIVAGLVHDWKKLGEENEKQRYTVFLHPVLAANTIRKYSGKFLTEKEIEFIASCVETHMGEFNEDKRSTDVLPKPQNDYQFLVHLADYLASRKPLDMEFDEWKKPELPPLDTYVLNFGKYKDERLVEVAQKDKGYIDWLKENYGREPVRSLLKQL